MSTSAWHRVYGPTETYECGDVEYEVGSTYQSDKEMATIIYFVIETGDTYGVLYRVQSWPIDGDEDDATYSYDWACQIKHPTLAEAIASADSFAQVDKSSIFA